MQTVLNFVRQSSSRDQPHSSQQPPPDSLNPAPVPSVTVEAKSPAPVRSPTDFCADDADVVIRAAGTRDFRVHKVILSLASPVFKDMLTLPQPPADNPDDTLPHIDVEESAETWEDILLTIYPTPNPVIYSLDDLESLLHAAKKYEMQSIIDTHKRSFEYHVFIQENPLRLYAIACACGFEDQAKYVARHADRLAVTRHFKAGDTRGLDLGSYHNLVSFLAERDNEWNRIIGGATIPSSYQCNCDSPLKETLYGKVKENLKMVHLETEEIYSKALESLLYLPRPTCRGMPGCVFRPVKIKEYIKNWMREREEICDKHMW